MELFVAGFNAWNQLQFEGSREGSQSQRDDFEPDDILTFTLVLTDHSIDQVEPFLSYTKVRTTPSGLRLAGVVPQGHEALRTTATLGESKYFAEASNGVVVVYDKETKTLTQYPSTQDLLHNHHGSSLSLSLSPEIQIIKLVSYETGFAALSSAGTVFTWGDERYSACLGREVTDEAPANHPHAVTALDSLPTGKVIKIAAGGTILAALTSGNDLYAWGHPLRTEPFRAVAAARESHSVTDACNGSDNDSARDNPNQSSSSSFFNTLTGDPTPVDIDDWKDIADIAMGERHLLALTTEGRLFAIGDNTNGQLGLPAVKHATNVWTKVDVEIDKKAAIMGIAAGPRNSFVIVRRNNK